MAVFAASRAGSVRFTLRMGSGPSHARSSSLPATSASTVYRRNQALAPKTAIIGRLFMLKPTLADSEVHRAPVRIAFRYCHGLLTFLTNRSTASLIASAPHRGRSCRASLAARPRCIPGGVRLSRNCIRQARTAADGSRRRSGCPCISGRQPQLSVLTQQPQTGRLGLPLVGTMKTTYQKPTLLRRDILPKLVASMQVWSDVQLVTEVEAED
jgi:hypothetical protein